MKKFNLFISENKLLCSLGFLYFLIIYSSTYIPGYGFFIDEFYYIACANHPALGYVDHPPLAPIILAIYQFIFGNSLYLIRIIPAMAGSVTIIIVGLITKELGGNKRAQIFAAFCIFASPVYAAIAGFYSMNVFEPLLSSLVFYFLILMIKENNPRRWITIGVLFGLALMNKHTAGIYIFLVIAILLMLPQRKLLFNKWFILCIIISGLIFLPNIIWQIVNDYPSLEFYRNISSDKNVPVSPLGFVMNQILFFSPFIFPFWITGAAYFLIQKDFRKFRLFGILFINIFLFFILTKTSRPDRLAFIYPIVIPAGVIFFENVITKFSLKWVYGIAYICLFLWFIVTAPLALPYLSYENSEKLTTFLGLNTEIEKGKKPKIPQLLADRIGWKEKADMIAKVLQTIPESERSKVMIAGTNYGNSGAFEYYGKKYNFPAVVGSHNNYYLWSKDRLNGEILLQLGTKNKYKELKNLFDVVDSTEAYFNNEYCSPHEQNLTVFICKNPKLRVREILERSKFYY